MSRNDIGDCLKSVIEQTTGIRYEIIIVDNKSDDGTVGFVRENFPDVTVIESAENRGFGAANNIGIRHSKGYYVFLLNPDTVLRNNAIEILHDFMEQADNSNIAVCGGQQFTVDGKTSFSYGYFKKDLKFKAEKTFQKITGKLNERERKTRIFKGYVSGADFFARRELIVSAGLFDEDFFLYFEETELSFRLCKAGHYCAFLPDAEITHKVGGSGNGSKGGGSAIYEESKELFFRKTYGRNSLEYVWFKFRRFLQNIIGRKSGK